MQIWPEEELMAILAGSGAKSHTSSTLQSLGGFLLTQL